MKFSVLTLFPEMMNALGESIIGRAVKKGIIETEYINIRDFTKDKHRRTDDYPYGAGGGMVTCKVSGKRELLELTIKPEAVDPEDVEMLQDLVLAAVNEALRNGEKAREDTMSKLAPTGMSGLF